MNRDNLSRGERAVLEEIEQRDARWLVSRAWLTLCLRQDRIGRSDYPTDPRALTRYLGSLQKWDWLVHIVAPDQGAWYVPKLTWDSLPEGLRSKIYRGLDVAVRGSKRKVVIARLGPLHEFTIETLAPLQVRLAHLGVPENTVVGPDHGTLRMVLPPGKWTDFLFLTLEAPEPSHPESGSPPAGNFDHPPTWP